MKNSNKCLRCGGSNIVVIQNDGHPEGGYGNNIQTNLNFMERIYVN